MKKTKQKTPLHIRQARIRQLLKDNSNISIPQLSKMFNVSEMTIHRDLNMLQSKGHIVRTHGGVMPAERMVFEFDFADRRSTNRKTKQAIAAEAFKLIKPGNSIILDTGTTTLELACLLRNFEDLTVLTPSLAVASVLQFSTSVETILLGGIIRKASPDLTGVVAEMVLNMFMVDIAFQGADGIGLDGEMYNADMRIANVDRKMRQRARNSYILSDSTKIGRIAFASNGSLSEVDALITDSKIQQDQYRALKKTGVKIIVVKL